MKLQPDDFSCGIYAIINAAAALGIELKKRNILKHSGTTRKNGTDEYGIMRALKKNKLKSESFDLPFIGAEYNLKSNIKNGNPVIIYFEELEHWCTVIGTLGNKYIIFDSYEYEINGVKLLSTKELKSFWEKDNKCYGIAVMKK